MYDDTNIVNRHRLKLYKVYPKLSERRDYQVDLIHSGTFYQADATPPAVMKCMD